jgi:hypothetical protein
MKISITAVNIGFPTFLSFLLVNHRTAALPAAIPALVPIPIHILEQRGSHAENIARTITISPKAFITARDGPPQVSSYPGFPESEPAGSAPTGIPEIDSQTRKAFPTAVPSPTPILDPELQTRKSFPTAYIPQQPAAPTDALTSGQTNDWLPETEWQGNNGLWDGVLKEREEEE